MLAQLRRPGAGLHQSNSTEIRHLAGSEAMRLAKRRGLPMHVDASALPPEDSGLQEEASQVQPSNDHLPSRGF